MSYYENLIKVYEYVLSAFDAQAEKQRKECADLLLASEDNSEKVMQDLRFLKETREHIKGQLEYYKGQNNSAAVSDEVQG